MRFHLSSFLFGYAAGAATVLVGQQLRPVAVEVAAAAYQAADALAARLAMVREDVEDFLAEARGCARARGPEPESDTARATA